MRAENTPQRKGQSFQGNDVYWALFAFIAMIVLVVGFPFLARDMFVRDIYGPLLHSDPFVRVNYAHFAFPAVMLAGVIGVFLTGLGQAKHWLGISIEAFSPFIGWCIKGLWVCLTLMVMLPIAGGLVTERYVKAEGYVYCGKLFELGVATYSRGYLNDPRVCVSPTALAATLERYGYSDAARRYRFEKE